MTFHPDKDSSRDVSEIVQRLDNISESIIIESESRNDNRLDDETEKLILKKLAKILRLLEKKDQT